MHRYLSSDVLLGTIGRIIGHNPYAYCRNTPVAMGDPNGFDPRLFYFYGGDQEKHATSNMNDLKKEFKVQGYFIQSPEDFRDAWSDMYNIVGEDDIDVVVINLHGNPDNVEFIDHDSLDYSKYIDTFILLSCNASHLSAGRVNVASKILLASNSNIGKLVAPDGTHYKGTSFHPHRGIKVVGDDFWKQWLVPGSEQKSSGFILYTRLEYSGFYRMTSIGKSFKSVRKLLKKVGW